MKQVNGHNDTALIVAYYGKIPPPICLYSWIVVSKMLI